MATTSINGQEFQSWAVLHTAMLNALAKIPSSGAFTGASFTAPNGQSVQYRNLDELKRIVEWTGAIAAFESGAAVGRTYAKNGGGGRW